MRSHFYTYESIRFLFFIAEKIRLRSCKSIAIFSTDIFEGYIYFIQIIIFNKVSKQRTENSNPIDTNLLLIFPETDVQANAQFSIWKQ